MQQVLRILSACTLVLVAATASFAATINVSADGPTAIQDAITAAAPGDILQVEPGTYTSSLVIGKSLTITSTGGAAVTTIAGTATTAVTITASDVTLDGFTVTNPGFKQGIYAQDQNGITITNNVITDIGSTDPTTSGTNFGIAVVSSAAAVDGVTIAGNTVSNIAGGDFKSADGIALGWSNGSFDITNAVIENNLIDNITSSIVDYAVGGRGAYGVIVNHARSSSYTGRTVGVMIRNNTITNLDGLWAHAIGLEGNTPDAVVEGNILSDITDHKSPSDAIGVFFEDNDSVASTVVRYNSFTNVSWSVVTHPTTAIGHVDAPLNWHGSADAATVAATVYGDIGYHPWLASGVDADLGTPGFQPDFSALSVGDGGSIQAAIDAAADGGVINVAAGAYAEGLSINKSISLLGPNAALSPNTDVRVAEAIISPPAGSHALLGAAGASATVEIKGLTFDMAGSANDDRFVQIINQLDNTWTFEHNVFTNGPECNNGAWYCSGANGTFTMNIQDNHFHDNVVSNGISIWSTGTNVIDIRDNVFEDSGGYAMNLNRVQGAIADNIIRDNSVDGPAWYDDQSGIILASTDNDVVISGNTFANLAYVGVYLYDGFAGVADVTGNTFQDIAANAVDLTVPYAAFRVRSAGVDISQVSMNDNAILNSPVAVRNPTAATFNAIENWYGAAAGPDASQFLEGDIAYDPWWADAAMTIRGSNMPIENVTQNLFYSDLAAATAAAMAGDAIVIDAGTLTVGAQVLVDKDLTITGAGADQTILAAGYNTGAGYTTTAALIHVAEGVTATIGDLAIDGSGFNVNQAIQSRGDDVTVRDCVIGNIASSTYDGRGIVFLTGAGLVDGVTMSNIRRIGVHIRGNAIPPASAPDVTVDGLTYTGKGDGDFLDYGVEFGGGGKGSVTGATITDCRGVAASDGSTSAGILVTDFYGTVTEADITDCLLTANSEGIAVGYADTDMSITLVRGCNISGNTTAGITSTGPVVDALGNWWGDPTGPFNATNNPGGLGNAVDDEVLFDPWLTGAVIATPDPLDLTQAAPSGDVTFSYLGGYGPAYGYSVTVLFDSAVATATFSKPATGPFADSAALFQVVNVTGGVQIDGALPGSTPGIAMGDLFQATFTAAGGEGAQTPLDITVNYIADYATPPVTDVPADDGLVRVDTGLPVVSGVLVTDTTIASTDWVKDGDDITVTATVTDGSGVLTSVTCDLSAFGGAVDAAADGAPVGDVYTWTFTPVAGSGDGAATATVTAVDGLGNTATGSDDITADNTAPTAVTGLTAMPGHDKLHLAWSDPSGLDANYAGVEVRFVAWGDYPEYAGAMPAAPADHTAGDLALQETGTAADWTQATRDIYVVAAFAYDLAGNYGPADASDGNWDASTSYFLGDVSPLAGDGYVGVLDVDVLGNAYGTASGETGYNNTCDVGPTDDWSRFGLPQPDDLIGFFDLMIFAMNFGEVSPSLEFDGAVGMPVLAWTRVDADTWALDLLDGGAGLKGLNVTGELPGDVTCIVQPGALVAEQDAPVFVDNVDRNGLDAGLAVLGFGQGLSGNGTVLTVRTSQPVDALEIKVSARDINNQELLVEMAQTTGVEIPAVHALHQNFPNPFNPMTTIKYALPAAEDVRLAVYGVDGRLVRTLVNERREAGNHEVVWRGDDTAGRRVATGTYFYVINAGDFHQVRKLSLVK
jgi:hypothetical protein